jgi:hypothetical protein
MPAIVQHAAARQALTIIAQEAKDGRTLSYQDLAIALERSPKDARAMAQVCDLLDSAATLAHRPLMALWTVRNAAENINPKAWVRDALPGHEFSDVDEHAIRDALDRLAGMGNRKAWTYVHSVILQEETLARLEGREPPQATDSLNDLGSDEPRVIATAGRRYVRDHAVRAEVVRRSGGACEFCGGSSFKRADGTRYLECHHIIALSDDGEDRLTNVIALCPGHHREAHFGEMRAEMEQRMVIIVRDKELSARGPHRT